MPYRHPFALLRLVSPMGLRLALLTMLVSAFCAISVQAQEGYYIAFRGGVGKANDVTVRPPGTSVSVDFEDLFFAGAAFGKAIESAPLRLEGEFTYFRRDIERDLANVVSGETTNLVGMFNIYLEPVREKRVTPYIGGGIGVSDTRDRVSANLVPALRIDEGETVFAYQFKTGLEVSLKEFVAVGVGYRFFGTSERSLRVAGGQSFSIEGDKLHLVEFGLRFNF